MAAKITPPLKSSELGRSEKEETTHEQETGVRPICVCGGRCRIPLFTDTQGSEGGARGINSLMFTRRLMLHYSQLEVCMRTIALSFLVIAFVVALGYGQNTDPPNLTGGPWYRTEEGR